MSLTYLFATSCWIEGLYEIISVCIFLMWFFRFSSALLFKNFIHAWTSIGLPYKLRQHGIQRFYFVRVPDFSGVFNLWYIFWTQCCPLCWWWNIPSGNIIGIVAIWSYNSTSSLIVIYIDPSHINRLRWCTCNGFFGIQTNLLAWVHDAIWYILVKEGSSRAAWCWLLPVV